MTLKKTFLLAVKKAYEIQQLSYSQGQAVLKPIEKKSRNKKIIENWKPISLLNVDTKLISQALSERIRNTLPCIVSEIQTAYVNLRITSEGGSLIDELLEFCDMFDNEGFLITINIEKTLNFFDHNFLITILSFGNGFINHSYH